MQIYSIFQNQQNRQLKTAKKCTDWRISLPPPAAKVGGASTMQKTASFFVIVFGLHYLCSTMLKFVAIILSGIAVGLLLRKRRLRVVPHTVTVLIWALLFFLGVEVGENPQVINGISNLGLEALWLSLAGIAGTVLFSWALWRWVDSKKKGGES